MHTIWDHSRTNIEISEWSGWAGEPRRLWDAKEGTWLSREKGGREGIIKESLKEGSHRNHDLEGRWFAGQPWNHTFYGLRVFILMRKSELYKSSHQSMMMMIVVKCCWPCVFHAWAGLGYAETQWSLREPHPPSEGPPSPVNETHCWSLQVVILNVLGKKFWGSWEYIARWPALVCDRDQERLSW